MTGAGVPTFAVALGAIAAVIVAFAWPILGFIAVRALTRIANELEKLNMKK